MSVNSGMDIGSFDLSQLPDNNKSAVSSSSFLSQYGGSKKKNFATYINSSNPNLLGITIISLLVNGGYNGYSTRISSWESVAAILATNTNS